MSSAHSGFAKPGTPLRPTCARMSLYRIERSKWPAARKVVKKPICPNDEVKISQSYNDTFPTAMYVAAAIVLTENLAPALKELHAVLATKSQDLDYLAKIERTHALEAAPLTADQEISGCSLIERELER